MLLADKEESGMVGNADFDGASEVENQEKTSLVKETETETETSPGTSVQTLSSSSSKPNDDKLTENLYSIHASSQQLLTLINNLLGM